MERDYDNWHYGILILRVFCCAAFCYLVWKYIFLTQRLNSKTCIQFCLLLFRLGDIRNYLIYSHCYIVDKTVVDEIGLEQQQLGVWVCFPGIIEYLSFVPHLGQNETVRYLKKKFTATVTYKTRLDKWDFSTFLTL